MPLLFLFLAFFASDPSSAAISRVSSPNGPLVSDFPCHTFFECSRCFKTVDLILSLDKAKAGEAFLSKCRSACGNRCEREPARRASREKTED